MFVQNSAVIKTQSDIEREMAQKKENRKLIMAKAEARKATMRQKEELAKQRKPHTDADLRKEAKRIAYAEPLTDNELEHDSAKQMRSLNARSEAFLVRETQMREREAQDQEEKDWESRIAAQSEYDRVLDVRATNQAEIQKRHRNKAFQRSLVGQIADNAHAKMMDAEQLELDKQTMARKREEMNTEEIRKQHLRNDAKMHRAQEVLRSNQAQKVMREKDAENLRQADASIVSYQRAKVAAEAKAEELREAARRADNLRTAKLLAQQEKSMDSQAEEDEARANRATEQKERLARKQEEEDRLKIHRVNEQMSRDKLIAAEDRARVAQQAEQEKFSEARYLRQQQYMANETEREREIRKRQAAKNNQILLRAQMSNDATIRNSYKAVVAEEGRKQKMSFLVEKEKLDRVKALEMHKAQARGINTQDIGKLQTGYL